MKRLYKNLMLVSLSLLVSMFLAIPANAQHRGNGGGNHGGGGGHSNGGGGGGRSQGGGGRSFNGGGGGRSFNSAPRASVNGRATFSQNRATRSFNGTRGNVAGRRSFAAPGNRGRVGVNGYRRGGFNGRAYAGARGRGFYGRGGYGRGYGGYHGYGWHGRFGYGGFYYHGGFYNRFYGPRLGFSLGFLPYGYYPFYWGGLQYYYSNGYYYNYDNNQYTVVEPPVGADINSLPSGAQSIMINGQQYYELNGVYYVAVTKDDGSLSYEIAGKDGELNTDNGNDDQYNDQQAPAGNDQGYDNAPQQQPEPQQPRTQRNGSADIQVGDVVQSLPKDSRGVTVNGQKLFVSPDDVYYKQTRDNDGNVAYKIVGLPSEEPDDNN